jgi:DNA-binding transcriptional ArsR family regulator
MTDVGVRAARKPALILFRDHGGIDRPTISRPSSGVNAVPRRMAEGIELLADPTRRRIVALLAARVWHPADIASAIGLGRPAVSRQLSLLTAAGLIRWRRSGMDARSREYFIDPGMHDPIIAWLAGVDLRRVRPIVRPDWSPPPRVHRLRHDTRALTVNRE